MRSLVDLLSGGPEMLAPEKMTVINSKINDQILVTSRAHSRLSEELTVGF